MMRIFVLSLLMTGSISTWGQMAFSSNEAALTAFNTQSDNETRAYACFFLADRYMDNSQYDSAQLWLNNIYTIYKVQQPKLFNYFVLSRQAEVYYYNNLLELGLNVAQQALLIAEDLKDSILIADASNFTGLFYTNNNQAQKAIPFFLKGIQYAKQPPYPKQYLTLSLPHHIYGNLAEAFEKTAQYDSALWYSRLSLQKAEEIQYTRGMALAEQNSGKILLAQNKHKQAIERYEICKQLAIKSNNEDVLLLAYSGMALCYAHQKEFVTMQKLLDSGFTSLQQQPNLNILFSKEFIKEAISAYKLANNQMGISKAYQSLFRIDSLGSSYNNLQVQRLIKSAGEAEKEILKMQVNEAQHNESIANTYFLLALAGFFILLIISGTIYYFIRQKIKVSSWRIQISQDLHDEVGGTLSGIGFMSEITQQRIAANDMEGAQTFLQKIVTNCKEMSEKMGDIVWAVNPANDSMEKTIEKLSSFAKQIGNTKNIQVKVLVQPSIFESTVDLNKRKQLYLICKEAINNAIKYSQCKTISLHFQQEGKKHRVAIIDDGIGFNTKETFAGNGLKNMQYRASEIKGTLTISSTHNTGTKIELVF
ncbi:MAG: hypothetical protein RLY16_2178 [Bacteroidota bacterium]|jgi:signal transduction histidine kinase